MKDIVINAMRRIGIFGDENTLHSLQCLQEVVLLMDIEDIEAKAKDLIVLLKHLPESLINFTINESLEKYETSWG